MKKIAFLMLVISSSSSLLAAPSQSSLPTSLRACASEREDARRLACYDREFARAEQPDTLAEPQSAAADDGFGYRGAIARDDIDRREAERRMERLSATIAELSRLPHGNFLITLDNGQAWLQKSPNSQLRLKAGERITIKPGVLGSYTLVTASGRTTKVTRTK